MQEWTRLHGYMFDSLETSYIAQNVEKGEVYNFRLQARNVYGWGTYSEIVAIAAAGIPGQMSIPQTTADGLNIIVSWQPPYDNSDYITDYRVFVKASNDEFH